MKYPHTWHASGIRFLASLAVLAMALPVRAGELTVVSPDGFFHLVDTSTGSNHLLGKPESRANHLAYDPANHIYYYTEQRGRSLHWFLPAGRLDGPLDGYGEKARQLTADEGNGGGGVHGGRYYFCDGSGRMSWITPADAGTTHEHNGELLISSAPASVGDMTIHSSSGTAWVLSSNPSASTTLWKADLKKAAPIMEVVRQLPWSQNFSARSRQISFDSAGRLWVSSADGHAIVPVNTTTGEEGAPVRLEQNLIVWDMASYGRNLSAKDTKNVMPAVVPPKEDNEPEVTTNLRGVYLLQPDTGVFITPPRRPVITPMSPSTACIR